MGRQFANIVRDELGSDAFGQDIVEKHNQQTRLDDGYHGPSPYSHNRVIKSDVMKPLFTTLICFVLLLAGAASAQTRQSDREFEGLKGKVKSVLTERAKGTMKAGKMVETKRRKVRHVLFHPNGNSSVVKDFQWDTGELFETNTYILIDGDKATKIEMGPGSVTAFIEQVPDGKPAKPWDPRYDYKLKYKYDDRDRIAEEAWWQSNGELWLRYVYVYAEGERRELVYDKDGALNQKYIYKLDTRGNEIEMITYATTGKIEGKEKYEYSRFDPQGNWTERVEYEADRNSGFKFKLREVKYRTLIYY